MPDHNLTAEETRQRSRLIEVDSYAVDLDLSDAPDHDAATFGSVTTVRFRCSRSGSGTHIDLVAPRVNRITLNGRSLDPARAYDGARISLEDLAEDNVLVVDAAAAYSRTGQGLHRFLDPVDGQTYLYTHDEPADARRVFACFEQPDLKATYRFQVTAPAGWTVLSNAPADGGPEPVDDTCARWRFAPSPPISTYISAVVAGPYHGVTDHYRRTLDDGSVLDIPLGAYCRSSLAEHFDADEILTVTRQGLDFFHDCFDYPYPFGKYDQVFVPEYNIGAMENPGCVTFDERKYVFRGRVTQAARENRANTILHEMAHMWFGDLVTMRWWDDLWLKESFADFMGALALAESTRFADAWLTFANRRKLWAYAQDQLPTTHPIVAEIGDLEDARLNFDGITYAKGAAVLKQLVAYAGRDAFLEGARRYFRRHAYANTTLEDLLEVLEETSGRDLRTWARAWLQTSGVTTLTPEVACTDGRVSELAVVQGPDTASPRPHRVAVGLYRRTPARELVRTARAETDVVGERTVVPTLAGEAEPDLVLVNDEDLTYATMRFDPGSLATLTEDLGRVADPMARALCWSSMWSLTRDGVLPAREYLDLVLRFGVEETRIGVLQMLHQTTATALTHYVAPHHRDTARAGVADAAADALRRAQPGGDAQLAWARFVTTVAGPNQLRLLQDLLSGAEVIEGLEVDQELRWASLEPLAAAGVAGAGVLDTELARDATAAGALLHARCLAARPDPEVKAAAWSSAVESTDLTNAMLDAVIAGFAQPTQRELLGRYVEPYFAVLSQVWEQRRMEIAMRLVSGLYPTLQASTDTLARTDAWLSATPHAPALRRLVLEARDQVARALRAQARDADSGFTGP